MAKRVAVFAASGRVGQAQVRQLLKHGYETVAVSRNPRIFKDPQFRGASVIPADFNDRASLDNVFGQVNAAFVQLPSFGSPDDLLRQARNIAQAAVAANSERLIFNSTMWTPDSPPCGEALYDLIRSIEDVFLSSDAPVVIYRPVLFMDNLLTQFMKPALIAEGVYRYSHRPGMKANWISMDDVARFMIAALDRDDLEGRRVLLGGPESLTPEEVVGIFSEVLNRPFKLEYLPAREFANYIYDRFGEALGPRELFVEFWDRFYTFNNFSPLRPFEVDVAALIKEIPLTLTPMRDWVAQQDWTSDQESIGSFVG